MADKNNNSFTRNGKAVTVNPSAVAIVNSDETELGVLCRRLQLAIGVCNRIKVRYPQLAVMVKDLIKDEDIAHALWQGEASRK